MSDIDWDALLKAQQGQAPSPSTEMPLVTSCNEGAESLVGSEQFNKKGDKKDNN